MGEIAKSVQETDKIRFDINMIREDMIRYENDNAQKDFVQISIPIL
jgi:hypothetical protein